MQLNGLSNFFIYPGQKIACQVEVVEVQVVHLLVNQLQVVAIIRQFSTTKTYIHGVNVLGTCLTVVLKSGKVSAHIGGMQIIGTTQQLQMVILLIITETVGSIAQTDAGYYGHVAFVERVNSDGSILVSEMNWSAAPGYMTYRTIPSYQVRNYKFIH